MRGGGLVAFPTETVYGLGGDALNPKAVENIYLAKGRPSDNPLIVHIADVGELDKLAERIPAGAFKLARAFWPGPLTMVLPKKAGVPCITTGGLSTVAVRMPDHPIALELIRSSGCPVAAPSANLSGRPSPTKGSHVAQDLKGRIPMILWGDDCRVGIESTVLDLTGETPLILRPGILTPTELEQVLRCHVGIDPAVLADPRKGADEPNPERAFGHEAGLTPDLIPAPKAPGMKYTHYAPKAAMIVYQGERSQVEKAIYQKKKEEEEDGKTVGVILFPEAALREAAHDFFGRLRDMDDQGTDLILAGALNEENEIGFAVMNRMLKSAGYHVIRV